MQVKVLSICIILTLLTVGSLAFLGFGSANHGTQHNCLILLMSGGDCLSTNNFLVSAIYHVSKLQQFINTIISFDITLLAFSVFLIGTFLVFSNLFKYIFVQQSFLQKVYHRTADYCFILKKRFLRWLAFHKKRDPHAFYWVHEIA